MAQTFLYMFKDSTTHDVYKCACASNRSIATHIKVDTVFAAQMSEAGTINDVQSIGDNTEFEKTLNRYDPVFSKKEVEVALLRFTMVDVAKACEWNQGKGHPFPVMIRKYLAHKQSNKERLTEELARLERDRADALATLAARFDNQIADVNKRMLEL